MQDRKSQIISQQDGRQGLVTSICSELIMRHNKLYRKQAAKTSKHEDKEQVTVQDAQHNPTGAENETMYVSL